MGVQTPHTFLVFWVTSSILAFMYMNIFLLFFRYFFYSDFSDPPDMTDEYIDLSVCSNCSVDIHIVFNIYTKVE